jgi:uncharacterized protein (DUF58 family)
MAMRSTAGLPAADFPAWERVLGHRQVFILPTRAGLAFTLALFLMLVGSVNYDNNLGFLLTFLLSGLALVSMLHTYRNLSALGIQAGKVKAVFAGEEARFTLSLANRRGPTRQAIFIQYSTRPSRRHEPYRILAAWLPAGEVTCLELPAVAERRGRLVLGKITLASRYPLGLFRAWSTLPLEQTCLVFPRPSGTQQLPASAVFSPAEQGSPGQEGEDLSGFREYQPGDSLRHVHWRAVARGQGMPVKLFTGASGAVLTLRWEDTSGDLEIRLSQLARWVLEAERQGLRYGLHLPGNELPASGGEAHRYQCLKALALFGVGSG